MKAVIYLDSYFFMNLFLNSMLLHLLCRIRRLSGNVFRIFAGAFFGGLFACFLILQPGMGFFLRSILSYLVMAPGMILIAFGFGTGTRFLQNLIWFLGITVVLGGVVEFMAEQYIGMKEGSQMSVSLGKSEILIMAAIGTSVLIAVFKKLTKWEKKEAYTCDVTLFMEDRSVTVKAYMDSGNLLKEPLSEKPVMILEEAVFLELIEEELREDMREYLHKEGECWNQAKKYAERIRLIPYKSIGRTRGLLKGFIADRMVAAMGEKGVILVRPVIAVYSSGTLSSDGSYRMIVPLMDHEEERMKQRL